MGAGIGIQPIVLILFNKIVTNNILFLPFVCYFLFFDSLGVQNAFIFVSNKLNDQAATVQ